MRSNDKPQDHPFEYLAAAAVAACLNFPLWRASTMGQSGFRPLRYSIMGAKLPRSLSPYFAPPYKGIFTVIAGMAWARGLIFWGSDKGKEILVRDYGVTNDTIATTAPTLILTCFVQVLNQPLVRSSITLQDPQFQKSNTLSALRYIHRKHGFRGHYLGLSVQLLKSLPMFCTVILVKDYMEDILPSADPDSPTFHSDQLKRSAVKSATAGVAGAILTNPLDVIRNEMFKQSNTSITKTIYHLYQDVGIKFLVRGMAKNMMSVAMPIGVTIFLTDAFIQFSNERAQQQAELQDKL